MVKYQVKLNDWHYEILKEFLMKVLETTIASNEFRQKTCNGDGELYEVAENIKSVARKGVKNLNEIENVETLVAIINQLGVKEYSKFVNTLDMFAEIMSLDETLRTDKFVTKSKQLRS